MKPLKTYAVVPKLPPELEPLRRVVYDLHWSWNHAAIGLFRRLDGDLWEATGHNPVLMLGSIAQDKLDAAAADPAFLTHLERVVDEFETYRQSQTTWFERTHGSDPRLRVAYFSLEFGITELPSMNGERFNFSSYWVNGITSKAEGPKRDAALKFLRQAFNNVPSMDKAFVRDLIKAVETANQHRLIF